MTDEKLTITVEDPSNPITTVFGTEPFQYADEFFRYQPPYSRENVRVLLSVDPIRSNMNQGRCYGQCYRDDNDYPVAWVKPYGKGRVFYTTLGHNPHVFQDPKMLGMFLAAVQYALGDLAVDDKPRPRPAVDIDRILKELSTWDRGQDQGPLRRLERAMAATGRQFEGRLAAFLATEASTAAKGEVCRQLADVGTAASVPALAKLLDSVRTAEMARYALERISAPEAAAALREALASAPNVRVQTGIIHSLGRRRDETAVGALSNLLDSSDPLIAAAAANALGMIGSPEAERALFSVPVSRVSADALLNVADGAPIERAAAIWRKLCDPKAPSEIRTAAIRGMARRGADGTIAVLAGALTDPAADVQAAAIAELARLDANALVQAVPKLDAAGKIEALSQLALRHHAGARSLFADAVRADVPEIRIAALQGLAEIGSAEDIPVLVEAAVRGPEAESAAARFALTHMTAPGVDEACGCARQVPEHRGEDGTDPCGW